MEITTRDPVKLAELAAGAQFVLPHDSVTVFTVVEHWPSHVPLGSLTKCTSDNPRIGVPDETMFNSATEVVAVQSAQT